MLKIGAILREVAIHQRGKKVEEMTQGDGLNDAYATTQTRLKAQKGHKSKISTRAEGPDVGVVFGAAVTSLEPFHALEVEVGSTDLDPENVPALRTLLASFLGLVTSELPSSTVRLVHFTLQEHHVFRDPTLFHSPHSTITEVCLTYSTSILDVSNRGSFSNP